MIRQHCFLLAAVCKHMVMTKQLPLHNSTKVMAYKSKTNMTFMHTESTPPCRPGHCVGNSNSSWSIFKNVKPESPNPPDYVLQVRKYALHCIKLCCADC